MRERTDNILCVCICACVLWQTEGVLVHMLLKCNWLTVECGPWLQWWEINYMNKALLWVGHRSDGIHERINLHCPSWFGLQQAVLEWRGHNWTVNASVIEQTHSSLGGQEKDMLDGYVWGSNSRKVAWFQCVQWREWIATWCWFNEVVLPFRFKTVFWKDFQMITAHKYGSFIRFRKYLSIF